MSHGTEYASLSEQLTRKFFQWELRGRGWQSWEYPVNLEPPFLPFYFHTFSQSPVIDDGRRPGILGKLASLFSPSIQEAPAPAEEEQPPSPIPYEVVDLVCLRFSFPQEMETGKESAEQYLLNLGSCSSPVVFEIIGNKDTVICQIVCSREDQDFVCQQTRSFFPGIPILEHEDILSREWQQENESVIAEFGLSREFMMPLRCIKNTDVGLWTGIAGVLSNLKRGEIGILQVIFQKTVYPWPESIERAVTDGEGGSFFADAPGMILQMKEKISRPLFAAVIRAAAQSDAQARSWQILRAIGGSLSCLSNPSNNELIPLSNDIYEGREHDDDLLKRQSRRSGMLLNSEELASVVHLPPASLRCSKLFLPEKKETRTKSAPSVAVGHDLVLGENIHDGKTLKVSLSPGQRTRHMYVIGSSGTGKSTFLANLIVQDIRNGNGIAVLDPHGDLIDQILKRIPKERFDDVILFDPSDEEYPVGFNILSAHSETEKNLLASDLVAVFQRLSTRWGDQMNSILANAILAFLESEQGGTLADVRRFLIEEEFRLSFLKTVKDPSVVYYWQKEFPLLRGNPQAALLTRLDTFLRPKIIRYMVSQKEGRLNFSQIMNEGKVFLGKLSQGLIGEENSYLLGTLLVSKFHQTAISRQNIPESERKDFYLYIDEFQNFVTPSMAAILSGARKYRLSLTLAHQELRQLWEKDKETASSVLSNPYARICFRLGEHDAKKLSEGLSFFVSEDLQNLGVGEAVCRMEKAEYDFNLKTYPLVPPLDHEMAYEIIKSLSREKYGKPRKEIEVELKRSMEVSWEEPDEEKMRRPIPPTIPFRETKRKEIVDAAPAKEEASQAPITAKEPVSFIPSPEKHRVWEKYLTGQGGERHKYLQHMIKQFAEDRGYRATIEKEIPGGRIDVVLEREGSSPIACEISVTTRPEQEMNNIRKCLAGGYQHILLISEDRRALKKIKDLASSELKEEEMARLKFVTPVDYAFFLDEIAAASASNVQRTSSYKVNANYRPLPAEEAKRRKQSILQVVAQSLKRMGKKD